MSPRSNRHEVSLSRRGASANLAAEALRARAAEIERLLRSGAQAAAASLVLPLRLDVERCRQEILAILSQPTVQAGSTAGSPPSGSTAFSPPSGKADASPGQ